MERIVPYFGDKAIVLIPGYVKVRSPAPFPFSGHPGPFCLIAAQDLKQVGQMHIPIRH
jgi:hypothetical protein